MKKKFKRLKVLPVSDITINKNILDGEDVTNKNASVKYTSNMPKDIKIVVHQKLYPVWNKTKRRYKNKA